MKDSCLLTLFHIFIVSHILSHLHTHTHAYTYAHPRKEDMYKKRSKTCFTAGIAPHKIILFLPYAKKKNNSYMLKKTKTSHI